MGEGALAARLIFCHVFQSAETRICVHEKMRRFKKEGKYSEHWDRTVRKWMHTLQPGRRCTALYTVSNF
jgi:hypothetical protein